MADGATIAGRVRRTPNVATRGSLRRRFGRKSSVGFLMCLPLIVLIAALVIYPALCAIYLSMLNKKMTQFVGLSNYAFLLKRNTFQLVVFQSCFFAVSAVILENDARLHSGPPVAQRFRAATSASCAACC